MNQADTSRPVAPFTAGAPHALSTRRQLTAAMIGNVLEYYDFVIYAFFAASLARNFFQGDKYIGMLATFAAFGVGFLARPLGGLVIGRLADVYGRRIALLITIFGMALGTFGIGLLPTYASVGLLAPVLLVVLRLVQGLAAGGEWGSSVAFIVESAPANKRGYYGALGQISIAASALVSSVVAMAVSASFTSPQLDAWAWRIPFLIGGVLLPIGLYMRRNLAETPAFIEAQQATVKVERTAPGAAFGMMSQLFFGNIVNTVAYYVMLSYMPTFLAKYAGLTSTQALISNSVALVALLIAAPIYGTLSDRFGRKPFLLGCCAGFIVFSYLLFHVILNGASFGEIILVHVFLNLILAAYSGAGPATFCELFPTRNRTMLLSISYGLSTAIFGGFAPFISTWLINVTGSPIAPAFYVMAAAVVSGIAVLTFRETARGRLA